jgi:RNA polymerase sigma-70 factor, ECF subfamily
VSQQLLLRAAQGDEEAFAELTDPYRRELQFHAYRILGSVQDAEDVLQETMLSAWRGLQQFEERASLRSWLYRITTNRCLDTLRDAARRPPTAPDPPFPPPAATRIAEPTWLEPYPDTLLEDIIDTSAGPDARYETREAVELAFIAAIQQLPPRQRCVLVLRDVLGFHAPEVAHMLGASEDAVKSALKRARGTLEALGASPGSRKAPLLNSPAERALVERFSEAWVADDIDCVVALLTDDAWVSMPPSPLEYQGRAAISGFLWSIARWRAGRGYRLIPTRANTQPAFGCYRDDAHAPIAHAAGLLVLNIEGDRIAAITNFIDSSVLSRFGLPRILRDWLDLSPPGDDQDRARAHGSGTSLSSERASSRMLSPSRTSGVSHLSGTSSHTTSAARVSYAETTRRLSATRERKSSHSSAGLRRASRGSSKIVIARPSVAKAAVSCASGDGLVMQRSGGPCVHARTATAAASGSRDVTTR